MKTEKNIGEARVFYLFLLVNRSVSNLVSRDVK